MAMIAKLLRISGRVQGVSYRESLRRQAHRSGISGWARNRNDGSVEAFVQGDSASVAELIAWCERGPPAAAVSNVDQFAAEFDARITEFKITETI